MDRPLISIMTPVFNGEAYMRRAIACVMQQTYTKWEWIVVNDGSTDGTMDILNEITDKRVKIISLRENKGRGEARNTALHAATGSYIAVWDVDDIYFPNRLELQISQIQNDTDHVSGPAYYLKSDLSVKCIVSHWKVRGVAGIPPVPIHPSLLVRKDIFSKIGYNRQLRSGEDILLLLWLARYGKGQITDAPVMVYNECHYTDGDAIGYRNWILYLKGVRRAYMHYMSDFVKLKLITKRQAYLNKYVMLPAADLLFTIAIKFPALFILLRKTRRRVKISNNELSESNLTWLKEFKQTTILSGLRS